MEIKRGLWIAFTVLVLVLVFAPLVAGALMGSGMMGTGYLWPTMMGPGMMGRAAAGAAWFGDFGWLVALLGGLMMAAFWGALILGVVLLVKWAVAAGGGDRSTPLDVLKRRYAAGEITREQYEEARQTLAA